MTSNDSNSPDIGFIVLIVFAILALIPLAIGFDSFEELFRIGKIILIAVLVLVVVASAVFGYLFFKGRIKKRNTKKRKNSNDNENSDNKVKSISDLSYQKGKKEAVIVVPKFEEA